MASIDLDSFSNEEKQRVKDILEEVQFDRDRRYLGGKNRKKDKSRERASVAICGLRDPKDGLRRVNFVSKDKEEATSVKIIKCFDIGIGANRVGERVQSIALTRSNRGFVDYRG